MEITLKDENYILEILRSIRPPYKSFQNTYRLADIVSILEDIWDEDELWFYYYFTLLLA